MGLDQASLDGISSELDWTAAATASEGTDDTDDPLLACLAFLARSHGLPFSRSAVVGHLPIGGAGRLSAELFPRAAARLGLKARVLARRPSQVPGVLVPYIVLFRTGEAGIVVRKPAGKRRLSIVFPELSDTPRKLRPGSLDKQSSGVVIYLTREHDAAEPETGEPARRPRHWFWSEVLRFWPAWLQIVAAALLVNLLGLAFPLFVMNVYDRVIPNFAIPTLWALCAGIGMAVAFEFLLRQLRAVALDEAGCRVDMRIASSLFEHVLALPMRERREDTGALANAVREFETVRDFFTSSSIIAITDLLFIGVFIVVLMAIVGPIAYVPLAAVPLVLVLTLLIQLPLSRSVRLTQAEASRRHSLLVESLAGAETIKAVAAEGVMQRRWEHAVAATARANAATRFWSSLAVYSTAVLQQVVGIVILVWGVFLVADGQITVGGLIAASLLGGRVLAPLGNIAMTLARAQHAFTAMRGISGLMHLPSERAAVLASGERVREGRLDFRNVHFAYDGASVDALSNISFRIEPGERVGIVGRVGSGKSTLGKVTAGLYQADKGSVLVDGAEIRRYDPAELRRGVGFVGQEAELFAGTLRDNITIGCQRASEAEIAEAARLAGIDAFTAANPMGLALRIGERGRGLSGGQRQAVALARMLLRNPKILFLDEPSSGMDANTEAELIRHIGEWARGGATLLVCTHRMSFLEVVDRLLVLDRGRLVADGPKAEVLARLGSGSAKPRSGVVVS
jgi:ATP-binding cassette subfamily C protein LapB